MLRPCSTIERHDVQSLTEIACQRVLYERSELFDPMGCGCAMARRRLAEA